MGMKKPVIIVPVIVRVVVPMVVIMCVVMVVAMAMVVPMVVMTVLFVFAVFAHGAIIPYPLAGGEARLLADEYLVTSQGDKRYNGRFCADFIAGFFDLEVIQHESANDA